MDRRRFTAAWLALPWAVAAGQDDALASLLRAGGCAVLLRHARTVAGTGDPPGFRLDLCSTQRNLSEQGRAQARRIGEWFKARHLQPRAVQSSAWCRCKDTADLAFGRHVVWPALNSSLGDPSAQPAQTAALWAALSQIPGGKFEVWVTHGVNIASLSGESPAMGEAFVVNTRGQLMARSTFE